MIDMVLATELSKHFEHVNKFISVVTKNNNDNGVEQVSYSVTPLQVLESLAPWINSGPYLSNRIC